MAGAERTGERCGRRGRSTAGLGATTSTSASRRVTGEPPPCAKETGDWDLLFARLTPRSRELGDWGKCLRDGVRDGGAGGTEVGSRV